MAESNIPLSSVILKFNLITCMVEVRTTKSYQYQLNILAHLASSGGINAKLYSMNYSSRLQFSLERIEAFQNNDSRMLRYRIIGLSSTKDEHNL